MVNTIERFAWYPMLLGDFKLTRNRVGGGVRKVRGIAWMVMVEELQIFNYSSKKYEVLSRRRV